MVYNPLAQALGMMPMPSVGQSAMTPPAGYSAPGANFDPRLFIQQQQAYQQQMWNRQLQQMQAMRQKQPAAAAPAPVSPFAGQSLEDMGPLALWRARMSNT